MPFIYVTLFSVIYSFFLFFLQNLLISQNPGAAANIHLSVNIPGLQDLDAQWNIRHDETTNWFLSSGCAAAGGGSCCGASCGSTSCRNCANNVKPFFCPYGGDPCGPGCYDAIGFTRDFPLRYNWNNVGKTGIGSQIKGHCDYDVRYAFRTIHCLSLYLVCLTFS